MDNTRDFVISNGILLKYVGAGGNVEIPPGVKEIGFRAFRLCSNLESVTIPGSVRKIDMQAFYFCGNLKNLTLSEGLMEIGHLAFGFCSNLSNVTIPASVTKMSEDAFKGCFRLQLAMQSRDVQMTNVPSLDEDCSIPGVQFC